MSSTTKTTGSFLAEWSKRMAPAYEHEYGGARAGVAKGEEIPFPRHKIQAAISLLTYGAPNRKTLTVIAQMVRVSSALLRVWRTEERFLALYRRGVWECADEYIGLLSKNWDHQLLAPYQEFQLHFGVALQEAILRRLCVDVLHMQSEWAHLGLETKWMSECALIGRPSKASSGFSIDENSLLYLNSLMLLATILVQRRVKDPMFAQWASDSLMEKWVVVNFVNTQLRAALIKSQNKEALELLDFVTARKPPLEDVIELYSVLQPATRKSRR